MVKIIQIKGVTKIYDDGKKAVDNLNMEIKKGEIFGFLGPNGAGKNYNPENDHRDSCPDRGEIYVNGYNISREPLEAKRSFTYVPDHPDIFSAISGIDYLNFIADIYGVPLKERKEKIEKYARDFEIYAALPKMISSYSHGMKQKLLISAALLPEPGFSFWMNPLAALILKSSRILKEFMKEHSKKGGTVLFSSHILEVVENLCDRIGIIKDGVLIACDSLENLKKHSDSSLEDIFMELTEDE